MKVKARLSKTNRRVEVTLRRNPEAAEGNTVAADMGYYSPTPAYTHYRGKTISGLVRETNYEVWTFVPAGKYAKLLYNGN